MPGQADDACFKLVAPIKLTRDGFIFSARHVAEHMAIPLDAHRTGIVCVFGFAHQTQGVANLQFFPYAFAFVKLKSRDWRVLHQNARNRWCRLRLQRRARTGADGDENARYAS